MNIKLPLLIVCMIQLNYSYAQLKRNSYQFPERLSKNYFFDPSQGYLNLEIPNNNPHREKRIDHFKINRTFNFQRSFDNNSLYLEWYDFEKYLNTILDTILPTDFIPKKAYKVYIKRTSTVIAEIPKSGIVFISIGLINECENEADLAYILARLIGHEYFNQEVIYNSELLTSDLMSIYTNNQLMNELNNYDEAKQSVSTNDLMADSFAIECLKKVNLSSYNINPENYIQYESDNDISYIKKTGSRYYNLLQAKYLSKFAKNNLEREFAVRSGKLNNPKNYLVDSSYFSWVKKISSEECQKINFESGNYKGAIYNSFKKYLLGDNSLKNIYNLFESIRRHLYLHPELEKKGFLAEDFQFIEFIGANSSILVKPQFLFYDSSQFSKVSGHPLIKNEVKPFNSYEDAYWYFIKIAEERGFNESNFSQALYYYAKKNNLDFTNKLNQYIEKGGGIFNELAANLKQNGFPNINSGKTIILIDNMSNYSDFDNYYHSLQRMISNKSIYNVFSNDTSMINLVLVNELIGVSPKKLYEYQKLTWHLAQLYSENDREIFLKKSYNARESMEQKSQRNKFNKNLLIFCPELYNWFIEKNASGVLYQKIKYEYSHARSSEEYHNFYEIGYFNFFDNKPYFGKCIRNGNIRKQKMAEMATDARNYLLYKE